MCFSASASVVAAAALLAIGALTVKRAERKAELPFVVLVLEPVPWRRMVLYAFLAIGTAAGLYLLINMVRFPITSQLVGAHIEYVSPHFYVDVVMGSYLAGTCLSALFSSHKVVNVAWCRHELPLAC